MNKARGEVRAKLGGEQFIFCATLGAIAEIEGETGRTILQVLSVDLPQGSMRTILTILKACATVHGDSDRLEGVVATVQELADVVSDIFEAAGLFDSDGSEGNGGTKTKASG